MAALLCWNREKCKLSESQVERSGTCRFYPHVSLGALWCFALLHSRLVVRSFYFVTLPAFMVAADLLRREWQRRWAWCRDGSCHANLQAIECAVKVRSFTIHFVDEGNAWNVIFVCLPPDGFALGFDPFTGGKDDDTAIENAERAFNFGGAVSFYVATCSGVSMRLNV